MSLYKIVYPFLKYFQLFNIIPVEIPSPLQYRDKNQHLNKSNVRLVLWSLVFIPMTVEFIESVLIGEGFLERKHFGILITLIERSTFYANQITAIVILGECLWKRDEFINLLATLSHLSFLLKRPRCLRSRNHHRSNGLNKIRIQVEIFSKFFIIFVVFVSSQLFLTVGNPHIRSIRRYLVYNTLPLFIYMSFYMHALVYVLLLKNIFKSIIWKFRVKMMDTDDKNIFNYKMSTMKMYTFLEDLQRLLIELKSFLDQVNGFFKVSVIVMVINNILNLISTCYFLIRVFNADLKWFSYIGKNIKSILFLQE